MTRKQIVENNPVNFCLELQRLVQEGYEIDDKEEFQMLFHLYTIGMKKVVDNPEADAVFGEAPKKAGRPFGSGGKK